ncbi:hypothetical protein [Brevibacillus sp. SYSU BS000544]|uniref:hypothetical protein n=1 Tax=Brevibacillus sp. SYSU BS000544 TaxID=3416443 RepID=UPI003CE5191E
MENMKDQNKNSEVESLMEIVELINAKGDQGEIEEIINREESNTDPSPKCEE